MVHCVVAFSSLVNSPAEGIQGIVHLNQKNSDSRTKITGTISGLPVGKHGIGIVVYGNLTKGKAGAGGVFNPMKKKHGAPADDERKVGSLGNIEAGADGVAKLDIEDKLVQIYGAQSVIGRALVVYEKADDLGKGGVASSLDDGNVGDIIAGGIIGIAATEN